ncbi:Putative uncharacterized protein [Mycobacterium tuberculosis variant bovis]|uniref:Uncharacterized protein n=2 Tax=Mycobacterium tuberculosis TaxID=1773 RepID=Q8VKL0_MYCTO|nr:hypothetical protein MT0472.1 [Mycobacterium tuberculosis CDC1551]CEJ32925.1 Putative uncharacterized protein [Mycobacterium tuberculosis variant bovis]CEJ50868.1 Putative uncharacterized protein [Mycobacterium tuberculosis variant caprae]COV77058.1 Uncharacterised protein [Mycobacterium tuberculosis]CEJ34030.1 Putative uncharacterized protein [Mycobacterium tuberculosis variant bovis]
MLQQLQRQMESERIVEFDQLGRGDVAQRRIQPAGPAPSNRRPGHRSLPATTPGMGTFSVLLVTGTTGTTPRSRRIAAALALSLLTITAGRRIFAALPRAGSRSTCQISPRSIYAVRCKPPTATAGPLSWHASNAATSSVDKLTLGFMPQSYPCSNR